MVLESKIDFENSILTFMTVKCYVFSQNSYDQKFGSFPWKFNKP